MMQESGTSAHLMGVSFTGEMHGAAVGGGYSEETGLYGVILTTHDGGQNWESRTSGSAGFAKGAAFFDVSFGDADRGVAVGTSGIVARTEDGGYTWTEDYPMGENWNGDLLSVSMSDASHGTIVGYEGTILRTTDGGLNWTAQVSGTTNTLSGVSFMNNNNGLAVGETGTILYTSNGGVSWAETPVSSLTDDLFDVSFTDLDNILIVGAYNAVARISEGFTSVRTYLNMGSNRYSDIFFGASLNAIVGSDGQIFSTKDDGESWEAQQKGEVSRLRGVSFSNAKTGTVVGHNRLIMRTHDGGVTWVEQFYDSPAPQFGAIKAVAFFDNNNGFATIGNAYSDDIGVSCLGHIIRTKDGGSSWDVPYSYTSVEQGFNGVTFLDASSIIAVGVYKIDENGNDMDRPGWIKSTDGGDTWDSWYFSGLEGFFTDVAFSDDQNGVMVGYQGMILHTPDGDETWGLVESGTNQKLNGVCFADDDYGAAVGDQGTILYTTDGGLNWEKQSSGIMEDLYSVSFVDAQNGVISGRNGIILRTNDGGINWHLQPSRTQQDLYAITMIDAQNATVVGNAGSILRTSNGGAGKYHLFLGSLPGEAGELSGTGIYFAGENVDIEAEANSGYEFLNWTDDFGNQVSSSPDFSYEMPGADIRLFANFQNVTANREPDTVSEIRVFPNPAREMLTVESEYEILEVRLFDYMGKQKIFLPGPDVRYEIELSGFRTGVYLLQIHLENRTLTQPVLVVK